MIDVEKLLIVWVILTLVAVFVGLVVNYLYTQRLKQLSLAEFINIAIASATIVSSCSLVYRVITSPELLKLLQFDIYALLLGAIAVIWLSIQQIWQIFP